MFKLLIVYVVRLILKVFYVFPIKQNRIVFMAYHGKSFSCNPKYIYEYMACRYGDNFEYVWVLNKKQAEDKMIMVTNKSFKFFYYLLTAKVIVSNNGLGSYIPKRQKQFFINTWHGGGAYKRINVETGRVQDIITKIFSAQTDIHLSSSKKFTEVMSTSSQIEKSKFMECGMPRNDLLFGDTQYIECKVRKFYGLEAKKKIALYAPTYRGKMSKEYFENHLNIQMCLEALHKRFGGEWVFAFRSHYFIDKTLKFKECIDMSAYTDMQELLCAADVLITDYSSTIWDYSLTFKAGFLFVPDIEEYAIERSFYTNPETWAFPLARSNEELTELIRHFDDKKNRDKIIKHQDFLGNFELGRASQIVGDFIYDYCMN